MPFELRRGDSSYYEKSLDVVADSEALVERIPEYAERLEELKIIRDAASQVESMSSFGRGHGNPGDLKAVASIPQAVLLVALAIQPDLLLVPSKFYKWMDRHPEYMRYHRRRQS